MKLDAHSRRSPDQVAEVIADVLAGAGAELVASLPDGWIAPLIRHLDGDARFRHVPVNREESAVGLCSGAFFGGKPGVALMGASGFLTCIYAITKINYSYHIPLFLFATLRGVIGDPRPHHIANGLYLTKLLDSISLPSLLVEERKSIERIPAAFKHCQAMNRPEVVIFTEAVLLGEA